MSKCKFCGSEIVWIKEGRKNKPLNGDGGSHACDEMKKSLSSVRDIDPSTLPAEEIARYEQAINSKARK